MEHSPLQSSHEAGLVKGCIPPYPARQAQPSADPSGIAYMEMQVKHGLFWSQDVHSLLQAIQESGLVSGEFPQYPLLQMHPRFVTVSGLALGSRQARQMSAESQAEQSALHGAHSGI